MIKIIWTQLIKLGRVSKVNIFKPSLCLHITFLLCIGLFEACNAQTSLPDESGLKKPSRKISEDQDGLKEINELPVGKIQKITFVFGEDRLEEGFGKYTENNLTSSRCVFTEKKPSKIAELINSLRDSGLAYREPSAEIGWEPREGLFFSLKDGTEIKFLFDNDSHWNGLSPGAINNTPVVANRSLNIKLYEWAAEKKNINLCRSLLARRNLK